MKAACRNTSGLRLFAGGSVAAKLHGQVDQRAHAYARGALGVPRFHVVLPGEARDVQVNPGRVTGKFLEEHGGDDGAAALAAADVLNIGDAALDHFAVIVIDGQLPHFFAGGFGARQELVRKRLVGAEHADVHVVDAATLTGAVVVALSNVNVGVFGSDQ